MQSNWKSDNSNSRTCQGFTLGMGASTNFLGCGSVDCCWSDAGWGSVCGLGSLCGRGAALRSRSLRLLAGLRACEMTGTKPSSSSSSWRGGASATSSVASMFSLLLSLTLKLSTDAYEGPAPSTDTRAAMPLLSTLCKPGRALRADLGSRARRHAP